jgi:hypothetical protein
MRMRENLIDIYKVFTTNENLLRLLYYQPIDANDNPLDPAKPNILDLANKWDIIQDRIKTTEKVDDLDDEEKCRLLFYAGRRSGTNNYILSNQEFAVDILCHFSFEETDLRMSWICDTVNSLVFDEKITGIKKISFKNGNPIKAPNDYVGYRLIYEIVSGN